MSPTSSALILTLYGVVGLLTGAIAVGVALGTVRVGRPLARRLRAWWLKVLDTYNS